VQEVFPQGAINAGKSENKIWTANPEQKKDIKRVFWTLHFTDTLTDSPDSNGQEWRGAEKKTGNAGSGGVEKWSEEEGVPRRGWPQGRRQQNSSTPGKGSRKVEVGKRLKNAEASARGQFSRASGSSWTRGSDVSASRRYARDIKLGTTRRNHLDEMINRGDAGACRF